MSDFFGQLEQQLREVARADLATLGAAGVPAPVAVRRRRVRMRRRLIIVLLLLLAAGTAVAATGIWRPILGNTHYRPLPTISGAPPPAAQLAILGVLRRPQTAADRGAATLRQLQYATGTGVRTDYIRLLRRLPGGGAAVLEPVARLPAPPGPPVPASVLPRVNALCVIYSAPAGSAARACFSTRQVLDGLATASAGNQYFGLVPDGVTSVTLHTSGGGSAAAPVTGNFFVVTIPPGGFPDELDWSAAGRRVKVVRLQ